MIDLIATRLWRATLARLAWGRAVADGDDGGMSDELRAQRIDLAKEPAFGRGGVRVRPPALGVELSARREILEPRVMQVLTALAQAGGEVVSRDELIERCWDG